MSKIHEDSILLLYIAATWILRAVFVELFSDDLLNLILKFTNKEIEQKRK